MPERRRRGSRAGRRLIDLAERPFAAGPGWAGLPAGLPVITISTHPDGTGHVVAVRGDLSRASDLSPVLRAVERVADTSAEVKIDVGRVELIDLEGIAVLMRARQAAGRRGIGFRVVEGSARIRRRLEIAGVLDLLETPAAR